MPVFYTFNAPQIGQQKIDDPLLAAQKIMAACDELFDVQANSSKLDEGKLGSLFESLNLQSENPISDNEREKAIAALKEKLLDLITYRSNAPNSSKEYDFAKKMFDLKFPQVRPAQAEVKVSKKEEKQKGLLDRLFPSHPLKGYDLESKDKQHDPRLLIVEILLFVKNKPFIGKNCTEQQAKKLFGLLFTNNKDLIYEIQTILQIAQDKEKSSPESAAQVFALILQQAKIELDKKKEGSPTKKQIEDAVIEFNQINDAVINAMIGRIERAPFKDKGKLISKFLEVANNLPLKDKMEFLSRVMKQIPEIIIHLKLILPFAKQLSKDVRDYNVSKSNDNSSKLEILTSFSDFTHTFEGLRKKALNNDVVKMDTRMQALRVTETLLKDLLVSSRGTIPVCEEEVKERQKQEAKSEALPKKEVKSEEPQKKKAKSEELQEKVANLITSLWRFKSPQDESVLSKQIHELLFAKTFEPSYLQVGVRLGIQSASQDTKATPEVHSAQVKTKGAEPQPKLESVPLKVLGRSKKLSPVIPDLLNPAGYTAKVPIPPSKQEPTANPAASAQTGHQTVDPAAPPGNTPGSGPPQQRR